MNYYIDTEFLEGTQSKRFLGVKYGETKPTIDLISIGIVSEDGREYYAISNEFNLKEAWNRYELKDANTSDNHSLNDIKDHWLRENVLKPIWCDLFKIHGKYSNDGDGEYAWEEMSDNQKYVYFKLLLTKYGKSNKEIAQDVKDFVLPVFNIDKNENTYWTALDKKQPVFYAYYADYDWVAFCWLFGKMNDLPKGFPMLAFDLKQIADDIWEKTGKETRFNKGQNEHNALADAKWNKEFHKFLNSL